MLYQSNVHITEQMRRTIGHLGSESHLNNYVNAICTASHAPEFMQEVRAKRNTHFFPFKNGAVATGTLRNFEREERVVASFAIDYAPPVRDDIDQRFKTGTLELEAGVLDGRGGVKILVLPSSALRATQLGSVPINSLNSFAFTNSSSGQLCSPGCLPGRAISHGIYDSVNWAAATVFPRFKGPDQQPIWDCRNVYRRLPLDHP